MGPALLPVLPLLHAHMPQQQQSPICHPWRRQSPCGRPLWLGGDNLPACQLISPRCR